MPPRPTKKTKTSHAGPVSDSAAAGPAAAPPPGGDDLEDNFLIDDEYLSDGPQVHTRSDDDDEQGYLSPPDDADASPDAASGQSKKRPATRDSSSTTTPASKKAKKDKLKSKKKAKIEELGLDESTEDDTALLPVEVALDRLSEKQAKALPKLSGLELDEMRLNQSMIQDTSSITTRADLLAFMKEALPTACTTLGKLPKAHGSPRIIVLSGAALRVADLCRQVKTFRVKQKDGNVIDVGKLFAKHFKLNEHAEYLAKTYVGIAVGTPNRIEKLLNETDSLKLTHLSHLILDTTHLDAKKRSLMDLPDARGDLFKLLGCPKIMERLREGKMKLVLF